ncbi:uncharacterized protein LOC142224886 [Haematobia irritans]|uniref:uncharacterized protein LOC142224886 n=1 Tax=Haematobia irritans TaxID=7368 RepID=UPI003F4FE6CF
MFALIVTGASRPMGSKNLVSLVEFESALNGNELPVTTLCLIETHRDEVKSIWTRLKQVFEQYLADLSNEEEEDDETDRTEKDPNKISDIDVVKAKYKNSYSSYCRCITKLSDLGEGLSARSSSISRVSGTHSTAFHLPPIELNTFHSDYKSWPTFRDMFTAICVNNSKLSPVEKLFYLTQKTKGEAHEIVTKSPLTNEGFSSAWRDLCNRFENRRVLVNGQLKTLFSLQAISSESAGALKRLQRDINSCISTLRLYRVDVDSWNPIFVFLCSNCLPESTLTLWEQTLGDKTSIPLWTDLDEFLTNRYRTLESVTEIRNSSDPRSAPSKSKSSKGGQNKVNTFQTSVNRTQCRLCPNEFHYFRKCPRFMNMDQGQRLAVIKANNMCLNCFSSAHATKSCKSKHSCYKCKKRHNTLLHKDLKPTAAEQAVQPTSGVKLLTPSLLPVDSPTDRNASVCYPGTSTGTIQSCFSSASKGVLLGTAVINILHLGTSYRVRALIDSGSQGSFISENLFNLLRLPYRRTSAIISGLNQTVSAQVQKECRICLGSDINPDVELTISALVVPHLSNNLPSSTIDVGDITDIPDIPLADKNFYRSAKVDLLLGADVFPSIMLSGCLRGFCGTLMAQETVFGWILTGPIPVSNSSSFSTFVSYFCEISLDKEISKFWEVENVPKKPVLSSSDDLCERLYRETTSRSSEGRYIVYLPFKEGHPQQLCLGRSRQMAMAQFYRNEARLLRNPDLKQRYDENLDEYLSLGHMTPIEFDARALEGDNYYLPHHAVIKPESTTTKVRVVFNASAPSSNGASLNDVLHVGPVLQNDLTNLILKWRFHRFVFNGDIEKMYRQILVHPSHARFQRILYRKSPQDPVMDYELKTVTFGVNCAPYLAIRTIIQLADDIQDTFPMASRVLRTCMYVDDALVGAHDIQTAIDCRDEIIKALGTAGFVMRKWASNSKSILAGLPAEDLLYSDFLDFDDRSSAKTLGIRWNARLDYFYFSAAEFPEDCVYTKREVLSQISRLFDPAGWLAPVIIVAKIIMQKIWLDRTEWDEVISSEALRMWKQFQDNYSHINSIRIPRWLHYCPESTIQIHGFADSSERAYAAVLYIRISYQDSIFTNLIASKTRVAPLKTLSIPRLELCGASLLAEMIDSILPQMEIQNYSLFCWTDSTIVLSWLSKPACCWNTFVANRVSKITQVVDPSNWFHVESGQNPADIASRGSLPQDLLGETIWWNGPSWLSEPAGNWPVVKIPPSVGTSLERKALKVFYSYFSNFEDILDRFSSFDRALRVICYVYRFLYATHPKFRYSYYRNIIAVSTSEIIQVRKKLVSICQKAYYPNEYLALSSKKSIPSTSPLLNLNPFIDPEGVMRICGRLEASPALSYNERHPIILPYACQYSRLLIKFIHRICLHGGNHLMLRLVRQQYWIPRVHNLIKTTIHHCKPCVIYKKKCQHQLMAALPPERCELSRPFTHTGLDFAGPFEIKIYAGRSVRMTKGYVCIFVCFSTKAIHLEATSDLSTAAFLAAFSRFVSRRGCPLHLHSDNGTTFVGASRSLAKDFIKSSQQYVVSNYAHHNITWHFIPPGAPHMGGLWEAGVKSFKQHFKKSAGSLKYTFEEFQTLLAKIEACLNSRPLTPSSPNPSDLNALTPGHFLIGSPILVPLDPEVKEPSLSIQNRWQRLKAMYQHFCNRWKNEYLKELQKRHKWKKPEANLKEHMLVVIRDETLPPNCWRLGRITRVYPGSDGRVRVADIYTQKGLITRPVTKRMKTIKRAQTPSQSSYVCRLCRQVHALKYCWRFRNMNISERMKVVKKYGYCSNCLAHSHSQGTCFTKLGCGYCHQRHHSLLHMHERLRSAPTQRNRDHLSSTNQQSRKASTKSSERSRSNKPMPLTKTTPSSTSLSAILRQNAITLLPTALVVLNDKDGQHFARCLLDSGVRMSSIAKKYVDKLGLMTLELDNETICPVVLSSCVDPSFVIETTLKVNSRICTITPKRSLPETIANNFSNLVLADKKFFRSSSIDIVLGADIFSRIIRDGVITRAGLPTAQNTSLGIIIYGTFSA